MAKKVKRETHKKFDCLIITQNETKMAVFPASATELWSIVDINRREPDKEKGYQRVLSPARVASIARYVKAGSVIPTSILVSFDNCELSPDSKTLIVPNKKNAGWVIDGQHRLAGIHESGADLQVSVVAFMNLSVKKQIEQFVKINKEAKNVPSSLYLDLLKHLPDKSEADVSKERAVDIAHTLRKDEDSPFFGRISVVSAPKPGQLSLTNFVRKIGPLITQNKGKFHVYSVTEQIGIFSNLYHALENTFPDIYEPKEGTSVFFKTIGFGALMNALPTIFDYTLKLHKGFKVEHISAVLKNIDHFDFANWDEFGTGTEAENSAAEDLREALREAIEEAGNSSAALDL
jgi:DGQHR domain-containing protein